MKTSEFIKQVNALGYTTHTNEPSKLLYITDEGLYLAVISLIEQYRFDLAFETKKEMGDLYSLIGVFIRTPISDRDEPKKYRLKHKYLNVPSEDFADVIEENENYLGFDLQGYYLTGDIDVSQNDIQTQFTEDEINDLPFKIDDSWEREEAMEKFSDMYDISEKHLCVLGEYEEEEE